MTWPSPPTASHGNRTQLAALTTGPADCIPVCRPGDGPAEYGLLALIAVEGCSVAVFEELCVRVTDSGLEMHIS